MNNEEQVLLSWKANDRPYKVWSKDFYSTVIVIAFLVSIFLFFIEGVMPVLVVWAVVFMIWAVNRAKPRVIDYSISNWGIKHDGTVYYWQEMTNFWIEDKWGSKLVRILLSKMPFQLVLLIDPKDEEKIKDLILKQVVYQMPKPTWSDNLIKWFGEKIPLD